jgi:hypothetical protein
MIATAVRSSIVTMEDQSNALHQGLAHFNRARLSPGFAHPYWQAALRDEMQMKLVEGAFIERERRAVEKRLAEVPEEPEAFIAWFEDLKQCGPGQGDPLFPWLADCASYEDLRWFLSQEVAGEAGFDDLVALSQLKLADRPKLELARNYWDEMGRGREAAMHGPMLGRLAAAFGIAPTPETSVWEALALGNLMIGLAANRRYAYQSIGALGVIELTAPSRAVQIARALKRLGLDGKARVYFDLHATLDIRHSQTWSREVLMPLVEADPRTARPLAEGALIRLLAAQRCFERYRRELAAG